MKTVVRSLIFGMLLVLAMAGGVMAQDKPCLDDEGKALDAEFRAKFDKKERATREEAVAAGKKFLAKYGECPESADFATYLKSALPQMEDRIEREKKAEALKKLEDRFFAGLTAKNWDEVYAAGKALLSENADKYRPAELVLGSIGLDETQKNPRITKYNDDTLMYAKMALADIEAGKKFEPWGFAPFAYKNKEDAIGWLNYTIGYILAFDKNNKREGATYLFKATQVASDTVGIAEVYRVIGSYYVDEMNKRIEELQALVAAQSPTDTEEVKAQKIAAIKEKQGLINGTVERALDAYGRAHAIAKKDPKNKQFAESLYTRLQDLYKIRFNKLDGLDAWVTTAVSKPMTDPRTAIAPVLDPEPSAAAEQPASPVTTVNIDTKGSSESASAAVQPAKTPAKRPAPKKKGTR